MFTCMQAAGGGCCRPRHHVGLLLLAVQMAATADAILISQLSIVLSVLCTACWPKVWQCKCSAHVQPHKVFLLLLQSYEAIQRRAVPDTPLMHFLHLLIQASCCCQPWYT